MHKFCSDKLVLGLSLSLLLSFPVPHLMADPADTSAEDKTLTQFTDNIFPLLSRGGEKSCITCHDSEETSDLVFSGIAEEDFRILLDGRYLEPKGPDTVLGRLTSSNKKRRMPKGKKAQPWSRDEIAILRQFIRSLPSQSSNGIPTDEQFPSALLGSYKGLIPDGLDNQFLSYTQLRGKILTIFNDNWHRNGKDLFGENVAFFGGADFKTRFNETTQPSASFLTTLDLMARDVGGRAFERKEGPFAEFSQILQPADSLETPDQSYRNQIERLYKSILFRSPTKAETDDAFKLIQNAFQETEWIRTRDYELEFELTVTDPATGLSARRNVSIAVNGEAQGVYQEFIDQSTNNTDDEDKKDLCWQVLARPIHLKANSTTQRIVLHNINTWENVSFAGVSFKNLADDSVTKIDATDASVQPEGAWKRTDRKGFVSFEDSNVEKGKSRIVVSIEVPKDGDYALSIYWRKNNRNARNLLVEVYSDSGENSLAKSELPIVPPEGEAQFIFDSSNDTLPYVELGASFRFGTEDYLEINNTGTRNRVAAGAVDFVSAKDGSEFTVDSKEAEGSDSWGEFSAGSFNAYNRKGTQLQDDNKNKGERFLRYRASKKESDENGWKPNQFYRARIHYPGKRDNEQRVPVVVRAQESSPIVQLAYTALGKADSTIELDASASYTVQHSALNFVWKQTRGISVNIQSDTPKLKFIAPRKDVQKEAWVALTRALMRHPDFLFTRPPSLHSVPSQKEKRRLQLVKLALDLVGRSPTNSEFERLSQGESFSELADAYLETQEFRDFYFHRIRLYLESQGTESQDEPARLWSYVAFNDLPFQQILTADHTVNVSFQPKPRPDYHGRTGLLTTKGFIEGKPGLPHFNYPAQVSMMFLGYIFEVPPDIVQQRDGITPLGTTDPQSACYSCHKILTPLAFQRTFWTDNGEYRRQDESGDPIDASDQGAVEEYPFKGEGMEAFATQAVKKERFIRTIINTHFNFFFGRSMRFREDERDLYKQLWDHVHADDFKIRSLIHALVTSPQYLEGRARKNSSDVKTLVKEF